MSKCWTDVLVYHENKVRGIQCHIPDKVESGELLQPDLPGNPVHPEPPGWFKDNRVFVVEFLMPLLDLRPDVRQVLRWGYGYDGSDKSYEKDSDGSTVVPDVWMGGTLKEPYGVGHDMLFMLRKDGKTTPDGHEWTLNEANLWYMRCMQDFGMKYRCYVRYVGLSLVSWVLWYSLNRKETWIKILRKLIGS